MTNILKTIAVGALLASSNAFAVSFQLSPSNADTENVVFNGTGVVLIGEPVVGRLNNTSTLVEFWSSNLDSLKADAAGQAEVTGPNDTLTALTIQLASGDGFEKIVLNPQKASNRDDGTIHYFVNLVGGGTEEFEFDLANGNNFITFTAGAGQLIQNLTLETTINLADVRQVRLGAVTASVPDGGTSVALLGLGMLGMISLRKFVRK